MWLITAYHILLHSLKISSFLQIPLENFVFFYLKSPSVTHLTENYLQKHTVKRTILIAYSPKL